MTVFTFEHISLLILPKLSTDIDKQLLLSLFLVGISYKLISFIFIFLNRAFSNDNNELILDKQQDWPLISSIQKGPSSRLQITKMRHCTLRNFNSYLPKHRSKILRRQFSICPEADPSLDCFDNIFYDHKTFKIIVLFFHSSPFASYNLFFILLIIFQENYLRNASIGNRFRCCSRLLSSRFSASFILQKGRQLSLLLDFNYNLGRGRRRMQISNRAFRESSYIIRICHSFRIFRL
jgi:hypothetical protein